jgi:hypothetical protein
VALTSDIMSHWTVGNETKLSTHFDDVVSISSTSNGEKPQQTTKYEKELDNKYEDINNGKSGSIMNSSGGGDDHKNITDVVKSTKTEPWYDPMSVDYVNDSQISVVAVMLIWMFYIWNCITYATLFQARFNVKCARNDETTEMESFGCELLNVLIVWYVHFYLLFVPYLVIFLNLKYELVSTHFL